MTDLTPELAASYEQRIDELTQTLAQQAARIAALELEGEYWKRLATERAKRL